LPLEGLDFVYQNLDCAAGDAVIEAVGKSSAAGRKRLSHSLRALIPEFMASRHHQTGGLYIFQAARNPVDCFSRFLIRNGAVSGDINREETLHARVAGRPCNLSE